MTSVLADFSTTPVAMSESMMGGLQLFGSSEGDIFAIDGEGSDYIVSGTGDDFIISGAGDDFVITGEGDDLVMGGAGDDVIKAGSGDDIVIGGAGSDVMTGGEGDDTFEFFGEDLDGSLDVITDFMPEADVVVFKDLDEGAEVMYDASTGNVSVDGEDVLKLDSGLDISIESDGDDYILF
jgi:Ca2+-binding RTX toxin-like protein